MVAGGASGIVAIARDLGADDRVVAIVQYLRVLIILLGMPLVVHAVFHPPQKVYGSEVFDPTADNGLPPVLYLARSASTCRRTGPASPWPPSPS